MIRMYGMHEKLLNNMKCKYLNGEITDFFEFFSGRWSHILHHDRFGKLQEINERIYRYNLDGNTNWLTEYLQLETMGHKREVNILYFLNNICCKEIRNLQFIHSNYYSFLAKRVRPL